MILNGIQFDNIEDLEIAISEYTQQQKDYIIATFNGVIYNPVIDPVTLEVQRMEKRRLDGIASFQRTQAGLRLQRLQNGASAELFNDYIYTPLATVINNINTGNWLDGYSNIKKVVANPVLTAQMILKFKTDIALYLVGEGNYQEFLGKEVDLLTGEIIM